MQDTPETPEDGNLRYLRWLVTILTTVMIGGFLVLIFLFVTRFPGVSDVTTPDGIALPEGVTATAYTVGSDWVAVVTGEEEILIYNRSDMSLRQRIAILPE